jgi:hypothetical protein
MRGVETEVKRCGLSAKLFFWKTENNGAPGETRTPNLLIRSQTG